MHPHEARGDVRISRNHDRWKRAEVYATIRLDVRRIQQLKDGDTIIGAKSKFTAKKNKLASPFRFTEVDIVYGEGFDKVGDVLDEELTVT